MTIFKNGIEQMHTKMNDYIEKEITELKYIQE